MIGLVRVKKDLYLMQGQDHASLVKEAKSRGHEMMSAVPDDKREVAQTAAERQAAHRGGSVIEDPGPRE